MNRAYAWGAARRRFGAWLVCALIAGCTPLSKQSAVKVGDGGLDGSTVAADGGDGGGALPDGSASSSGDGSTGVETGPTGEKCDTEGNTRCGGEGASRLRDVCHNGFWAPAAECGEGEVCTASAAEGGAKCLGVASICRGNASAAVCDSQGVMYHCGADGVIQSSESCPSVRHCQTGLAAMSCAVCLSSEFRCEADALERCNANGTGFTMTQTCAAGSCDAEGGRCRGTACAETRSVCRGDALSTCAAGETDFKQVAQCQAGLCDATRGACNRCVPSLNTCDGEVAVHCSADGANEERVDCTADGSHCVGAGRCVRCARDADCSDPGACMRAACNLAKGTCEPQFQPVGSACASGVCSSSGTCVACNAPADCPAPGDCQVRQCAAGSCMPKAAAAGAACGSGGKCDSSGHCASCIADADCPEAPACQVRHCDTASGACKPTNSAKGTKCEAGVCDGSGKCGGCNADADCPAVAACQQKFCNPSTRLCEPKSAADGGACNGAFGAGSCLTGHCVQCATDAACKTAGVCQEPFCRTSDNSCQQRPLASGADCGGGKVCDGATRCVECAGNANCGDNATCLSNACQCNTGYAKNPTGKGCNFDECAKTDDNRCGADASTTGNTCTNTVDGYDCTCAAPWTSGSDQCFQSGTGRTVKNTSSWNVVPTFAVVCDNAFDTNNPCSATGQLTWLNVCGLTGAPEPPACSSLAGKSDTLATVTLRRITYAGPLEQFGQPPTDGSFSDHVDLPAVGDVILVQSLTALYVMRITALDGNGMTYDWALIWRDTCWRPGGLTCTAACNCPGGN